jgi:hypothetical protein
MAHYAFLNEENIVTEVIVGKDETDLTNDWESFYGEIRGQICKRTSFNGNIRKNYAGIGYEYDVVLDAFIAPKCHDEATLNNETAQWICENEDHNVKLS